MKRIYDAANLPEAALLADQLRDAGIEVHVLNQNAVGAMGELPFMNALPQIWVASDDHAALAQTIIARYRDASVNSTHSPWRCVSCDEENPGSFDVCWSCGCNCSPT